MKQQITKKKIKSIIKNQPRIVLDRIDFSRFESIGIKINGRTNEKKATTNRMTLRKKPRATKGNQKSKEEQPQPDNTIKTIKRRTVPEIRRVKTDFKENDIVLVKWPYFPDWPAIIESIKGKSIHVRFFGDGGYVSRHKYIYFSFD